MLARVARVAGAGAVVAGVAYGGYALTRGKAKPVAHADGDKHHVVIVGAGAAGVNVASQLLRKLEPHARDVAIIEPSDHHYYQPWWTMTGGGLMPIEPSRHPMDRVIPRRAAWIKARAAGFEPEQNAVVLADGTRVKYDYLVVCPGIVNDLEAVKGLPDAIGKDGVATIYDYRYAPVVFENVQALSGGVALFTQPKAGVKCGGAPQKIMWLAEDWWRRHGRRDAIHVEFVTGTGGMFGVERYRQPLEKLKAERGVHASFQHDLVEVDGPGKTAVFQLPDGSRVAKKYDFLHVTPRMGPIRAVRESPLADPESGYVSVDKGTLQHTRYPNVFSIGDSSSLPTSKTAAAITSQAPVLVHNLRMVMRGKAPNAIYDGYTSCPILTRKGGLILAEFKYGGVPKESLGWLFDQTKEHYFFYVMKTTIFPAAYWWAMLPGRWYGPRTIFEPKFSED